MTTPAMKKVSACDIINARHLQTFTITVATLDLTDQAVLNTLIETVAINGQPTQIVLTDSTHITVSIEHTLGWASAAALDAALEAAFGKTAEFTVA